VNIIRMDLRFSQQKSTEIYVFFLTTRRSALATSYLFLAGVFSDAEDGARIFIYMYIHIYIVTYTGYMW
jgi:hypothetical protein